MLPNHSPVEVSSATSHELPTAGQNHGDEHFNGAEGQICAGKCPQGAADAVQARPALWTCRLHSSRCHADKCVWPHKLFFSMQVFRIGRYLRAVQSTTNNQS